MGISQSRFESECSQQLLSDMRSRETFNQYIDRTVQPDSTFLDKCSTAVDRLVRYFQAELSPALKLSLSGQMSESQLKSVNVKEILKSGSLGKSTAVRNKSDIDLIIFLNGIESVENLRRLMPYLLKCLEGLLNCIVRDSRYSWAKSVKYKYTSKFAVCCILTMADDYGQYYEQEVDLLPAVDVTRLGPLSPIYREMDSTDEETRRYYSACLSRVQRDFVQNETASAKVKNLIRLVKKVAKDKDVPMRSYFIELLVIYNQRKHPSPNFRTPDHVREILQLLCECETLRIYFTNNYNPSNYRNTVDRDLPYLLDPANPFMNTAPSPKDAKKVARMAKEMLPTIPN